MPVNPYESPRENAATAARQSWLASAARRWIVVGIGLVLGMAFSAWVAGTMMPAEMKLIDRLYATGIVLTGPIVPTKWGLMKFHRVIAWGWLGAFLIPAHPLRPHIATACLTLLGMSVWFFVGFWGVMWAIYAG